MSDDVHILRHGYTLADLERLARAAIWRVWGLALDMDTRYELAWSAIAEHLYAAAERPGPSDLITAGQNAIAAQVRADLRHHGIQRDTYRPSPKYAAYWEATLRPAAGPERRVVERAALWQIWPCLTDRERAGVLALAAHGTHQGAADALGIPYKTFAERLAAARRRFLAWWHEGEEPSRLWRVELRSRAGVAVTPLAVTAARLKEFAELQDEGLTQQQIAARMGIGYRSVQRLAALHRAERGL